MCKGIEDFKKSVRYSIYSFIHLSKAATKRCSFKYVLPNFLKSNQISRNLSKNLITGKNYYSTNLLSGKILLEIELPHR